MPRGRVGAIWLATAIACCCLALAGCGGGQPRHHPRTVNRHPGPSKPKVLDIYSSLPLVGPAAADGIAVADGIRVALAQAHGRAGSFVIRYRSLDDARLGRGAWDAGATAAGARRVLGDPAAIMMIGDIDSGASEISIPILNQAGIPQVSPASAYVGLTERVPGATALGEPSRYYPSGDRTFLRTIPNDSVQAAAQLLALRQAGCARLAVTYDRTDSTYGQALSALIGLERSAYGIALVSSSPINPHTTNLRLVAQAIKARGAGCVAYEGASTQTALGLALTVHLFMPGARIIASDRVCTSDWTKPGVGGATTAAVSPDLLCTAPTLPVPAYPGGHQFLSAWRSTYGPAIPGRYAIYGYETMALALDTIASLRSAGNSRTALLRALFGVRHRRGVLGEYGFDSEGDTTLRSYGLYRVGAMGSPVLVRVLSPPSVYVGSAR